MRNSKKDAETKNIVREEVEVQLETNSRRSLSEEEIDALYEEFISSEFSFELSAEEEAEIKRMSEVHESKREPRSNSTISHEDIIYQYKLRYVNEKNIKKYKTIDEQKLTRAITNIKDEFLEFVYNIITVNDVQFSIDRTQYCTSGRDLNGNIRVKVFSTIDDIDGSTLFHELGHAGAQCLFGDRTQSYNLLSMQIFEECTLADVLKKEISENEVAIKEKILEAHRAAVVGELSETEYSSIAENSAFLTEYYKLSRSLGGFCGIIIPSFKSNRQKTPDFQQKYEKYKEMSKLIVDKSMIATREKMIHCKAHKQFREDNEAVLDVLSSVCDMEHPYNLQIHTSAYYKKDEAYQVDELWANLFSLKITGRDDLLANVQKFLPHTYHAFEIVFSKVKEFFELQKSTSKLK
jgi:hypothetical protein